MKDPRVPRPLVLVVSHLFPTGVGPLEAGPWVAEQVDALTPYAEVEVLCCRSGVRDHATTRDSGVRVTYRDARTLLGGGRAGLVASSWRYGRILERFLTETGRRPD